jgi:diguanylate cyclase (GGDEF)-like protein
MHTPPTPIDEATRLAALRSLDILDTPPEERFDRLTRLARRLFGVPIAVVSLVDTNRQWFKSSVGMPCTETPREVSFCGHAILTDDILLVNDAWRDERFQDNPLVTGVPKLRFYAGCPLKVSDGSTLGTLCILDTVPRELDSEDRAMLRDLARVAEQELAAMHLATTDALTTILNRRGFTALAQQALNACARLGKTASVIFFDLDGFKAINDDFGHDEGDRALALFADVLRTSLRDYDVVGRMGGDEFVVVLADANDADIRGVLERISVNLAARQASSPRGYTVSYSSGHIRFDKRLHGGLADLLAEADRAMYVDKHKNRAARRALGHGEPAARSAK